jgi:putative transposase
MSKNYYSEINLHITWHTKESAPLLTESVESMVFAMLREKAVKLGGIYLHELGATPTHVHLALSVEPTVKPSEMIGKLKGYRSHETNQRLGRGQKLLQWQAGYGIVSFGTRDLPWVKDYVGRQKEHHGVGTIHDRLETINVREDG